jgi:hypothetical protein
VLKLIKSLLLCLALPLAMAAQDTSHVDLSKLSKEEQANVIAMVAKQETSNTVSNPAKVSEWVALGSKVADLIPVFAEKTGIAADKVLSSFSGKVLLTIVLVHFFWSKVAGLLLLFFGLPMWWMWFRRMFLLDEMTSVVHPNPILAWFGCSKTLTTYKSFVDLSCDEGDAFFLVVSVAALAAIIIGGLVAIL